jgi:hypothetical protein
MVIIHPARPTRKTVVLLANPGVGFAVVLHDIIWCPKAIWETHVIYVAPKRLGPWPLGAEAAPLSIVVPAVTWVMHVMLRMCALISPPPSGLDGTSGAQGVCSDGLAEDMSEPVLIRMRSLQWGAP